MLTEDPVIGGITYGKNGEIVLPEIPGLGATVDPVFLKSLKKAVIKT
jgi:L-alanine-DL-glutamate epimerase-like enolase superfamily enzyme